MQANPITYIGKVDVDNARQGYFLSKNKEALTQTLDRVKSVLKVIETNHQHKFHGLEDVRKDAEPFDPAVKASDFLKKDDVIYVPVSIISMGMLNRLLPSMGGKTTTEKYLERNYPALVMNPLLESAIICDLYLSNPSKAVVEPFNE